MELVLIRHGQSIANSKKLLISDHKDGLTDAGRAQSEAAAKIVLSEFKDPDIIFSSPWKRAVETADLIFFNSKNNILYDDRLAETNPGIYGVWKEDDFYKAFPRFHDNIESRYEGGESHLDMVNRVCEWVDEKVMPIVKDDVLFAVVTHGGPISVILQYLLSIPVRSHYPSFTVPNASYSRLVWRADLGRFCLITAGKS